MNDIVTPALIAGLLTAAGAPIASTVIWAVIDFLKSSPLKSIVDGREKAAAFVGAIGIVVLAILIGLLEVPSRYDASGALPIILLVGTALLAIYNIGRLAMAVHDDVNRYPNSLRGPDTGGDDKE